MTHCRVMSEHMSILVENTIRKKEKRLSEMAQLLSSCAETRDTGGDTGWIQVTADGRIDAERNRVLNEHVPDGAFALNEEFLKHVLEARPGELQTAKLSYGWEVFVLTDVQHAINPTRIGNCRGKGYPLNHNMKRTSPKKPIIEPNSYFIQTFGCQMNALDSERIAAELQRAGYHATNKAEASAIYVLNTCALRDHAEQKVYSYLGPHAQRKWDVPEEVTLVVAGCVAQQEGERLLDRVPEVDVVMGPQYANRIGEVIAEFRDRMAQIVAIEPVHIQDDISRPKRESKVSAWVNIMYGCLENCTYCVVPNTRGLEQSRSPESIRKEIAGLTEEGYKEVVLLGQNVDAYGRDLSPKVTLSDLLRYVHDVEGLERIRFTTGHPRYISENLINTVHDLPKVMEHFHIPPQSGDNSVLREMRRGYTRERYIEITRRIRAKMPDASICADMIVGFPGESDEAFLNSVDLVDEVVFDANMVRAYSARPKTEAGVREDQVDEKVKAERLGIMNGKMRDQAELRSRRYMGREVEVLVEGRNQKREGEMMGRERTNRVVFFSGEDDLVGRVVRVEVEEAFAFSLRGQLVEVQ